MKLSLGVIKKYWGSILAVALAFFMVGAAELTGEKEIIFPEIIALAIGAWVVPQMPWRVNRLRMFVLVCLAALGGMLIVRYLHIGLLWQITAGFVLAGCLLSFSSTTVFPIISACMLPILIGTDSWIYPLAAAVLAAIIISVQAGAERLNLRQPQKYEYIEPNLKAESGLWLKRLIIVFLVAIIPVVFDWRFCIAPPLLVAFVELSNVNSPARGRWRELIILIMICSLAGTACRLLSVFWPAVPLAVVAALSVAAVLVVMHKMKLFLPPAGAIAVLPMLVNEQYVFAYPFQVTIGFALLAVLAINCFKLSAEYNAGYGVQQPVAVKDETRKSI